MNVIKSSCGCYLAVSLSRLPSRLHNGQLPFEDFSTSHDGLDSFNKTKLLTENLIILDNLIDSSNRLSKINLLVLVVQFQMGTVPLADGQDRYITLPFRSCGIELLKENIILT